MNTITIITAVILALVTPIIGGLLAGVDRKLTAKMQERIGPPLMQPFYDVLKLWGKNPMISNNLQPILAFGYLGFALLAAGMVTFQQDLLLVLFIMGIADICLTVAAVSTKSPYSYLGGRREFLAMLSYEPVMLLVYVAIFLVTGSFTIKGIYVYGQPLLMVLPLALVALMFVLVIEMKKSPYDVSGSGHAHQELVRGVFTEFSGYTMALIELGHWTKLATTLMIFSLFWAPNPVIGAVISLAMFFLALVVDNIYPRLTWQKMLRTTWSVGFTLVLLNLAALVFGGVI
ncbi:NADH-quinone oxidoreductase subunit H [Candidatus Bathyarchaeota archaeon]|nr:NADH-quinone oxidoreductase subunit H [Candidatus Bathyarchaeota archaeon]TFH17629.1 MAG: NADH-quinone oxidoreductase subunit H [Candidatus Bathyarchaeota archaeon]